MVLVLEEDTSMLPRRLICVALLCAQNGKIDLRPLAESYNSEVRCTVEQLHASGQNYLHET